MFCFEEWVDYFLNEDSLLFHEDSLLFHDDSVIDDDEFEYIWSYFYILIEGLCF